MKYNDDCILDYLHTVDLRENIKPQIDGNCFWRGCIVSMLMSKYGINLIRAYDLLSKFTGQVYYTPGKFVLCYRDKYLNDDTDKEWEFTTLENAFRYQTFAEAEKALNRLDDYIRPKSKVIEYESVTNPVPKDYIGASRCL